MSFSVTQDHPDLTKPIWLHQDKKKFWEISLKGMTTTIRVGKLLDIETEQPDNQKVEKYHNSVKELNEYVEKHVNTKMSRGYKFETADDYEPKDKKQNSGPQINIKPAQDFDHSGGNSPVNYPNKVDANFLNVNNDNGSRSHSQNQSLADLTDISMRSRSNSPANIHVPDNTKLGSSKSEGISVLLAEKWNEEQDPTGYYMSEKLDGVRCFWDGSRMWSRNKNRFFCPAWFTKNWPKCQLDGELWTKRANFQRCVSIVKKKDPIDEQWKEVTYLVYDCPGLNKPFKDRIQTMEQELSNIGNEHLKVHNHVICTSKKHLDDELDKVLKKEGEGLMLREPNSKYEHKRSKTLLKVKVFIDEEATVIGHEKGSGRCADMLGALICQSIRGTFKVGSGFNDAQRRKPPKIGSKITFKYQNLSDSGKPRFPIFLRQYHGV